MAKNINRLAAVRARERAHVLDHAEHFYIHLAEHFDRFAHVGERDGRWRGNNNRARDRDRLDQRQLHVPGAGRKIDDQVIQFAPLHAAQKLRNHAVQHRPAPDHGLVAGIQQAHRNHFQPLRLHGDDVLIGRGLRLLRRAQHDRHIWPINVGVEQTHFVAKLH